MHIVYTVSILSFIWRVYGTYCLLYGEYMLHTVFYLASIDMIYESRYSRLINHLCKTIVILHQCPWKHYSFYKMITPRPPTPTHSSCDKIWPYFDATMQRIPMGLHFSNVIKMWDISTSCMDWCLTLFKHCIQQPSVIKIQSPEGSSWIPLK